METKDCLVDDSENKVLQQLVTGVNLWVCLASDFDNELINQELVQLDKTVCDARVLVAGMSASLIKYLAKCNLQNVTLLINPDCYNVASTYAQYKKIKLRSITNIEKFVSGKPFKLYNENGENFYFTPWNYGSSDNYLEIEIEYMAKSYVCTIGNKKLGDVQSKGFFIVNDRLKKLNTAMKKYNMLFVTLDISEFDGIKEIYRLCMANGFLLVVDIFYSDILGRVNGTFPRPLRDRCIYTILNDENPRNAFIDEELDDYNKNVKTFRIKEFLNIYKKMDINKEEFKFVYIIRPEMIDDVELLLMFLNKSDIANSAMVLASDKCCYNRFNAILNEFNNSKINIIDF